MDDEMSTVKNAWNEMNEDLVTMKQIVASPDTIKNNKDDYSFKKNSYQLLRDLETLELKYEHEAKFRKLWYANQAKSIEAEFKRECKKALEFYKEEKLELKKNLMAKFSDIRNHMIQNDEHEQLLDAKCKTSEVKPVEAKICLTRSLKRKLNLPNYDQF
jgi:hypothetical protein